MTNANSSADRAARRFDKIGLPPGFGMTDLVSTLRDDDYRRALDQALLFLKFRARSRAELIQKLTAKKVSPIVAERVASRLEELKLLDDRALARGLVESRRAAQQGDLRIRRDLRLRGLSAETVGEALAASASDAVPAADRAWAALQRRAPRLKNLDPRTARRRLEGFLFRQGFEADDVRSALRRFGPGDDA